MAKLATWEMIYPLFVPREFGVGSYEHMDDEFLLSLYRFRVAMDMPMIIHEAYATAGHATNSYHYKGRAADLHILDKDISIRRVIAAAIRCGLFGIGIYEHWNNPGFHFDNRPYNKLQIWKRNKEGIYIYLFGNFIPNSF